MSKEDEIYEKDVSLLNTRGTSRSSGRLMVVVGTNQNLFDIALQAYGSIESVRLLVPGSITKTVNTGEKILVTPSRDDNTSLVSDLQGLRRPATDGNWNGNDRGDYNANDYNANDYKV
jgi:hypothetical protein